MIFDNAIPFETLPESDEDLKRVLNYNPPHNKYTKKTKIKGRNLNETDRGGWRGYDRVYSKYFTKLRNENLQILEIGIFQGYGLLAWQRFFKNSKIYGIDIIIDNMSLLNIKEKFGRFKNVKCKMIDSTDENQWLEFYGKKFDIIIDDGDHHPNSQMKTLKASWKYLKDGGFYCIEDIGHRYGETHINELSNFLIQMKDQFEYIDIYSHVNAGLRQVLRNKKYLESVNLIGIDSENVCINEYIVVIKKKENR